MGATASRQRWDVARLIFPDFSDTAEQAQDSDALWFWRISEGKPGTKMPSYKNRLTDEQRWQLIAYMRSFVSKGR